MTADCSCFPGWKEMNGKGGIIREYYNENKNENGCVRGMHWTCIVVCLGLMCEVWYEIKFN